MRTKEVERIVIKKNEVNDFFFDFKSVWCYRLWQCIDKPVGQSENESWVSASMSIMHM